MRATWTRLGYAIAWATVLGGLGLLVLYLLRWEWHRSLIAGLFLVAAEIALATALIMRRLGAEGEEGPLPPSEVPRRQLDFRWLEDTRGHYGVFIPLLLGSGVIVSAVAWVIERLASGTTRSSSSLPGRYRRIALPPDPLVPRDDEVRVRGLPRDDDEQLHRLLGPSGDQRR